MTSLLEKVKHKRTEELRSKISKTAGAAYEKYLERAEAIRKHATNDEDSDEDILSNKSEEQEIEE